MKALFPIMLLASLSGSAHALDVYCGCEHMGSVWDGFCEATPIGYSGSGEQYYFAPFGAAIIPFMLDPNVNMGYYDVPTREHVRGGSGLFVTVVFPNGQTASASCGNGT